MQWHHYHDEGDKKSALPFWILLLQLSNKRYYDLDHLSQTNKDRCNSCYIHSNHLINLIYNWNKSSGIMIYHSNMRISTVKLQL